jgi:hypothetical protein
VKEREGVGGVDREGRRVSLGIKTERDEEEEWEIEKICIKNACSVKQ